MNVRRFVGKNAREAMAQARAAFGDQAVILSNRPVPGGVEILAMEGAEVPALPAARAPAAPAPATDAAPMSTVSFQDFVRERQRQEALQAEAAPRAPIARVPVAPPRLPVEPARFAAQELQHEPRPSRVDARADRRADARAAAPTAPTAPAAPVAAPTPAPARAAASLESELRAEMRQMQAMLSGQLASLSWFDTVRRSPAQARLLRQMLANGFSPLLARYLTERLPADGSDAQADAWLHDALARNLRASGDAAIQQRGGVFALVGPTGVGKTTTTAKIAARFAMEHGAQSVGLITVDTYRMAASDQLRAFGKLLNIPVHTARDAASLADLLDLFGGKKLVLVDTVGLGQRDRRLAELFAALPAGRIQRLLVLNAGAQGETLEEVVQAYSAGPGTRCVVSKLDEAARCGAVLDVAIRHQLVLEGVANGQRVPEDWHAPRAAALVHKALRQPASAAFTPDDNELGLVLTAPPTWPQATGADHA